MAYLSRVPINPMRRDAQWLLGSPQRLHASVLSALPRQPAEERTLWRRDDVLDVVGTCRRVDLLVLTQTQPSWAGIVEKYGWPDTDAGAAQVRDYSPVLDFVQLGRELAFRICANTSSVSHDVTKPSPSQAASLGKGRAVRLGHRSVGHQLGWFLERAAGDGDTWGFSVGEVEAPNLTLVERGSLDFRKGGHRVRLSTATFEGVLRITDTARFAAVLLNGMGRGKAYGCGLLTVARPGRGHVVAD